MINTEHEKFGGTIAGSRWFNGKPEIKSVELKVFEQHWMCPISGCDGEMKYTGESWTSYPPGHHHKCTKCEFTAAISDQTFPGIGYKRAEGDKVDG